VKCGALGARKTQTGDQLDDYLEIRAAKVETDGNADSTTISLSCLKADLTMCSRSSLTYLRNRNSVEDKLTSPTRGGRLHLAPQ